ncbi:DUF7424 family protein [Rhodobacter capsulatus]|uniref:DUF7424 family protein n=1 Tax=Rhodobacter capsulatus TaxID=1061 RepID=UPI0040285918
MKRSLCLIAIAALSGCKAPITATIYTSDIETVAAGGGALVASADIGIDTISAENCAKHGPAIATAIAAGIPGATFVGCTQNGMSQFAIVRADLPVVALGSKSGSALQIEAGNVDGRTAAVMRSDKTRIDMIKAALPRDIRAGADQPLEPQITIIVQNDATEPARVGMHGAFIDGEPYQLEHVTEIKRRGTVKITLSDVGNASAVGDGALLFWIAP